MNRLIVTFATLFLASCSGEDTDRATGSSETRQVQEAIPDYVLDVENLTIFPFDSEPLYSVELNPEQTFGDAGEPYLRNVIYQSVDDKGRVLISELVGINSQLHVYNPDGSYLTQVGRIGRGPGEHGMIRHFVVRAGKLFVHDSGNQRLNIYDAETYEFERSVRLEDWGVMNHEAAQNMRLIMFYTRDDGNHIAHFYNGLQPAENSVRQTYLLVNSEGDVLNPEPLEIQHRYSIMRAGQRLLLADPTLGGGSIFALSGDGTMYVAWPDDFLIKIFDNRGRYQSAFYYPVKGPPYDYELLFEGAMGNAPSSIRQQPSQTSEIEIPDTNPILREIKADDENRIWARVRTEDPDRDQWWVLDASGRLLARFHWPNRQIIEEIRNGYLYSRFTGTGEEAPKVIRHRIELTER